MQKAMDETDRRRAIAAEVQRRARHHAADDQEGDPRSIEAGGQGPEDGAGSDPARTRISFDQTEIIKLLEEEMLQAAQNLEFERAAQLRDKINEMKGMPDIQSAGGLADAGAEGSERHLAAEEQGETRREAPGRSNLEGGDMSSSRSAATKDLG